MRSRSFDHCCTPLLGAIGCTARRRNGPPAGGHLDAETGRAGVDLREVAQRVVREDHDPVAIPFRDAGPMRQPSLEPALVQLGESRRGDLLDDEDVDVVAVDRIDQGIGIGTADVQVDRHDGHGLVGRGPRRVGQERFDEPPDVQQEQRRDHGQRRRGDRPGHAAKVPGQGDQHGHRQRVRDDRHRRERAQDDPLEGVPGQQPRRRDGERRDHQQSDEEAPHEPRDRQRRLRGCQVRPSSGGA